LSRKVKRFHSLSWLFEERTSGGRDHVKGSADSLFTTRGGGGWDERESEDIFIIVAKRDCIA